MASAGNGTTSHLAGELFKMMTGVTKWCTCPIAAKLIEEKICYFNALRAQCPNSVPTSDRPLGDRLILRAVTCMPGSSGGKQKAPQDTWAGGPKVQENFGERINAPSLSREEPMRPPSTSNACARVSARAAASLLGAVE
jgi:hypothetical protein